MHVKTSQPIRLCRSDAAATGGELATQHQDTIQRGSCQLSPTSHAPAAYFSSTVTPPPLDEQS